MHCRVLCAESSLLVREGVFSSMASLPLNQIGGAVKTCWRLLILSCSLVTDRYLFMEGIFFFLLCRC
jgi:hypothetical protein